MSMDIRLPDLQEGSEAQQLRQIRSYLYQLAVQLQFALGSVNQAQEQTRKSLQAMQSRSPQTDFGALKSLIIKSADIVEAYSEEITRKLAGHFVAQSAFGTFAQETTQTVTENSEAILRSFTGQELLQQSVENLESRLLDVNAYIKTGLICRDALDAPVYGVEIGQTTRSDDTVTFRKYTRLSAGKLAFFDGNDTEVAFISDSTLFITQADIGTIQAQSADVQSLHLGNYSFTLGRDGHLTLA